MAVAYPEGECFFAREGLRSPRSDGYNANIPEHFHENMLVEYLWNVPAHIQPSNARSHPRSSYSIIRPNVFRHSFGCWHHLPISYGPRENNITRRFRRELCTDAWTFNGYYNGGSAEAYFMNLPLPRESERWIWIDMLAPIRAIYLPLAYTVSQEHSRLSAWVQVSFAQTRSVMIWRSGTTFLSHPIHSTYGLGVYEQSVIGFDVHGLMQLLALPRQLRNDNAYASKLIRIIPRASLASQGSTTTLFARHNISWLTVANANFGLDLQWKPAQRSSWLENFMKNVLTIAVGMIPVVGPILAVTFPIAWALISDPESAFEEMKNLMPGIDFADRIIREHILKSVDETRQYLPRGWEQMALPAQLTAGQAENAETEDREAEVSAPVPSLEEIGMSFGFAMAGEILAKRNLVAPPTDEPTDEPTEQDGPGEVLVMIPPTEDAEEGDEAGSAP